MVDIKLIPIDLSDVYILLFFCLWPDNSGRRRDNRTFEKRWPDQISAAATFTGKQTELSVNERKQRMEDESTLFSWKKNSFCHTLNKRQFLFNQSSFLSSRVGRKTYSSRSTLHKRQFPYGELLTKD